MLFYDISSGQSDKHNQVSDCKNTKNGQSMTVSRRLFPGLVVIVGICSLFVPVLLLEIKCT